LVSAYDLSLARRLGVGSRHLTDQRVAVPFLPSRIRSGAIKIFGISALGFKEAIKRRLETARIIVDSVALHQRTLATQVGSPPLIKII
jgi:hypothetical protein